MNDFQTPPYICKLMVSKLTLPKGSYILEPTPGEGNLVSALVAGGYRVCYKDDFWSIPEIVKYSGVVMNPPFSPMSLGYKILFRVMNMSDNIVALMPWLTLINSIKRTEEILSFGLKEVVHLPRTVFSGSRVQTCVLVLEKGYGGECVLSFYRKEKNLKI